MGFYTRESLETLRQKVLIVDVIEPYVELKRQGAVYKGLCPFHDEKTPSFSVQSGDRHYHCFGCGAHGDAIEFLMSYLKLSFQDAVAQLAERFQVTLDLAESEKEQIDVKKVKASLFDAAAFYNFYLLQTEEGQVALQYLEDRGIDVAFIRRYRIGVAPKEPGIFRKMMHELGHSSESLVIAGLMQEIKGGRLKEFFNERILFPIHNAAGVPIGFSGRKFREDTFGGKYVNTLETPLFKKSKVLFGLHLCRRTIAKERHAILVEGQIDALKMIDAGFNKTVCAQGTAFGLGHVLELKSLAITKATLLFDPDTAGETAAYKVGNLLQKEGIEANIALLPDGLDPDAYLQKYGKERMEALLVSAKSYLSFAVSYLSKEHNPATAAGKNRMVQQLVLQIRNWDHAVMVHDSLKELAAILHIPESMIRQDILHAPNPYIKRTSHIEKETVDPDRILEGDFLRWLLLAKEKQPLYLKLAGRNISPVDFRSPVCRSLYQTIINGEGKYSISDLLSLVIEADDPAAQELIDELLQKKIKMEKEDDSYRRTMQKILDRNWMEEREKVRMQMQTGQCTDEEVMELARCFDALKRKPPKVEMEEV